MAQRLKVRKPMTSTYTLAYQAICQAYERKEFAPLTEREVQETLESTPEIVFPAGTTLEEALQKLSSWKLIFRGKVHSLDGVSVIPLRRED